MTEALVNSPNTSFVNPDGSGYNYSNGQPINVVEPATGTTVTMTRTQRDLYIDGSATLATLTVALPPGPKHGDTVQIGFGVTVTALTVHDNYGNAVTGAATAGAQHVAQVYRFIGAAPANLGVSGLPAWVLWK